MRILLIGPQGAGKGTQAELLSDALGLPHIATGDLFRSHVAHTTPLGATAKQFLDRGELVPDQVTQAMVATRIDEDDAATGWILDGFPRNPSQAQWLTACLMRRGQTLTTVIVLDVPDAVLVERMFTRGRSDDTTDVISRRLQIYKNETAPLVAGFADIAVRVDGVGTFQDVHRRIMHGIGRQPQH